jgi:hypothetical protein
MCDTLIGTVTDSPVLAGNVTPLVGSVVGF